jgi:hypothetical protein
VPREANGLSTERMRELARIGAEAAIKDLQSQIAAIEHAFPDLRRSAESSQGYDRRYSESGDVPS